METVLKKLILRLPQPQFTRHRNLKLFEWMNINAPGKLVLNLGSGHGSFDHHLNKNIQTVNFDVNLHKPKLDVIGDAHFLPFKTGSFDIVYSIAVLEHVGKPWVVADEITRVLHSGGYVVLDLPFLNVIHDEHDYFRFTDKGIQSLFDKARYDLVFMQVSAGGGSFLSVFLFCYLKQFIPTKYLKMFWSLSMSYFFSLFKYLDIVIRYSNDLRITANSFSFIGRKR